MIPKRCKRLAEVDLPIAAVSRHAAQEKFIRHGHPSTLHLWWARRPLASSRSMLMAPLLPDPCEPHCPDNFRTKARPMLGDFSARPARWDAELQSDAGLRQTLLSFIADFANWDNAAHPAYLETGHALVQIDTTQTQRNAKPPPQARSATSFIHHQPARQDQRFTKPSGIQVPTY